MNKFTRLTALLLALMMIFSTFAAAEGYSVDGMTQEQWAEIVKQAEEEMFSIPEDAGKAIPLPTRPPVESKPYVETHAINLSEKEAFSMSAADNAVLTSEFAAQWQIALPGGAWADLAGQNGTTLEVNYAMLQNVLTDNVAELRQVEYDEEYNVTVLDSVKITIAEAAVVASLDAVSREGEAADATASTDANGAYLLRAANETGDTIVAVTVQYYYDGTTNAVASPWQATITKGEDLSHTITDLPEQAGYITDRIAVSPAAYAADQVALNKQTQLSTGEIDSLGSLELDLTDVNDDVVITVYYVPAKVQYKVEHYLQNVGVDSSAPVDEQYTLDTTDVYDINSDRAKHTGEEVGEGHAKTYTGFYSLWYDPSLEIAADGSTVLAVYYIRNYYLMSFDLGEGGYGVNPIYDQYGATIGDVGTPKRPGYTFVGWTADANNTLVDATGYDASKTSATVPVTTMPAENTTYYAVWQIADVTYSVQYYLENPDTAGVYDFVVAKTVEAKTGDLVNPDDHWDDTIFDADLKDHVTKNTTKTGSENVTVAGDGSTIVNVYYDRKEYTLKFYYAMSDTNGEMFVVGGSTWYFSSLERLNGGEDNALALMEQYFTSDYYADYKYQIRIQKGQVKDNELPSLTQVGKNAGFEDGVCDAYNGRNYYYVTFSAKYGANISALWPTSEMFNSITPVDAADTSYDAWLSAWNPEHHAYYAQHNTNQTIKGKPAELDYELLWDYTKFGAYGGGDNKNEIDFLCFWENGADISWSIPELYRYHIYVEALDDHVATDTDIVYNNKTYVRYDVYDTVDDSDPAHQTDPAINGLTGLAVHGGNENTLQSGYDFIKLASNGTKIAWNSVNDNTPSYTDLRSEYDSLTVDGMYKEAYFMYFYYSRNTYTITFNNPPTKPEVLDYVFGQDISALKDYEPAYPDQEEATGYQFTGWYTDPSCTTLFDFTTLDEDGNTVNTTMPANNIVLYAGWEPVQHTVTFYKTEGDIATGTPIDTQQVAHRSFATAPAVSNDPLTFVAWFYKDEAGNEHAVQLDSFQITGNTTFYAKWSYTEAIPVVIYYKLDSENGVEVAKRYEYMMNYSDEKTFEAKTGTDLYDAYQSGYYPTVTSHTITGATENVVIDENGVVIGFVYTFIYQKVDNMSYTVRYLDAATGQPLLKDKVVNDTTLHIVTEDYVPIPGYLPDVYTQRLLLNADPTKNVITFYYTRDTVNALYTVTHYTQNVTCTAYELYRDTTSFQGTIGQKYGTSQAHAADNAVITTGIDILTIPNFEFSHAVIVTRELAADNTLTTTPDGVEDADKLGGFSDTAFTTYIIKNPAEVVKALTSGGMDIYLYYNRTVTTLTIKKVGLTSGEHAIANVTLNGTPIQIVLDSSNATNGVVIENVAIGTTYSISEPDWAWRYDTVAVDAPSGMISGPTVVTITNSNKTNTWLDSECYAENEFGEAN